MKGISRHMIAVLLLAGLAYFLSGCSNEVLIGEKGGKDDSDDGKVMLTMTVRATPLSVSGDTDAGSEEERAIRSLYVFVFNIGASQYVPYPQSRSCSCSRLSTLSHSSTSVFPFRLLGQS